MKKKTYISPCLHVVHIMPDGLMTTNSLFVFPEDTTDPLVILGEEGHTPENALSRHHSVWDD